MKRFVHVCSVFVRVGAIAWLGVHFALTLLFCFPLNPLKMDSETLLYRTIGTYFSQNWALFAPNPIQANQAMLVRCLDDEEAKAIGDRANAAGGEWADITTPLFRRHQENRFSAYDRLSRPQTNFIKGFMNGGAGLQSLAHACRSGDEAACIEGTTRLDEVRSRNVVPLVKIASSFCRASESSPRTTHVAIRVREVPVTPWSKRDSGDTPKPTDFNVGVFPVDRDVMTIDVLRGDLGS